MNVIKIPRSPPLFENKLFDLLLNEDYEAVTK